MMSSRVSVAVVGGSSLSSVRGRERIGALVGTPVPEVTQNVLDVFDLIVGRSAHLAHTLGDAVHSVDVGLAEQPLRWY